MAKERERGGWKGIGQGRYFSDVGAWWQFVARHLKYDNLTADLQAVEE